MRFNRAPFAVLERLARGMTVPEIDRELGVTSSTLYSRVLVRAGALEIIDSSTRPFRFRLTEAGQASLADGPASKRKHWKKRSPEEREAVKQSYFDLILRVFLVRGGPLDPTTISAEVLIGRGFVVHLLREMTSIRLVRVATLTIKNTHGRPTPLWSITHKGIERLVGMEQADWRARVASVLAEAA